MPHQSQQQPAWPGRQRGLGVAAQKVAHAGQVARYPAERLELIVRRAGVGLGGKVEAEARAQYLQGRPIQCSGPR